MISYRFHVIKCSSSFEFLKNSFKIVKTVLYKNRWQIGFDLWAMVCQSCSRAHVAFEITVPTLESLLFIDVKILSNSIS